MPLARLAGLVASMPSWVILVIQQDELDLTPSGGGQNQQPPIDQLAAMLDQHVTKARESLKATNDDFLTTWRLKAGGQVVMNHVGFTDHGSREWSSQAPKLRPDYLARWEVMRESRMSGSSETDPNAKCLSAGMPGMMSMAYGMEIQQTKDKITIYGELNDVYRRIYLDGRKPSQRTLDDPTFAGYSVGHWEGDTLVVETVALREDTLLDLFSPHSEQLTVRERIRFTSPGILEDRITSTDPKALTEPFTQIRTYRKASPPNDELREFSCAEGLSSVK